MSPIDPPAPSATTPRWLRDVERAKTGDQAAFARLHRAFGATVHGLLLARVDPASADDLTQEVFLAAWQRLEYLHDPQAWPAWLGTIARNRAVDHQRRRAGARRPGTLPPDLPTSSADAATRLDAEHLLAHIRALPEAHAEPLILRLVEGLSGPEIAERTGRTPGSVRVNLHRGMKMLRERLGRAKGRGRR